ncbi:DoxX family protein [Chitinophaga sp.]|uniref:DoxX family protein n=1 Tax=Chitinophaga sp. TaxID=1869181 RepID=UPI0031D322AF
MAHTWKSSEKAVFRLVFLFFFLQVVPLDWKYWRHVFAIDWSALHFGDIFYISRYTPQWLESYRPGKWGLFSWEDWGINGIIALAGAIIWGLAEKGQPDYGRLQYLLRALVRYRLAVALLAYGFIKLFPMQAPYPSLSHLNTAYGDFSAWKLFALSLGIVPGYESFLGVVETLAGLLLLFRRTATLGASIVIFFTGNVFMSNLAYEGGEVVYSFYLVSLALFVVAYDLQRIISLIILRRPAQPAIHRPLFITTGWRYGKLVAKALFIFFFVALYGSRVYTAYAKGGYHYPAAPGLKGWEGIYNVAVFRLNGQELPYALNDSIRWKNVVFEKWATLSIGISRENAATVTNTEEISVPDGGRTFESDGVSGRRYYAYKADTAQRVIVLADNSRLRYERKSDSLVVLAGLVHGTDSIYAELQRTDKRYLLQEAKKGRRKPLKL